MKLLKNSSVFFLLLLLASCIDPFAPPEIASAENYLVVDGFPNTGQDASQIQLRRTQNVSETGKSSAEVHAQVAVEGSLGSNYPFTEEGDGIYRLGVQQFNETEQYRLRIKTANGKEYLSAYVPVINTPLIDSISNVVDRARNGVQFYVNTHDPLNKTRFYRWKYEETWEYRSAFSSDLEVAGETIVPRTEDIYTCWQTEKSTNILLSSSVKLSHDIIREFPINFVSGATSKLLHKYSILVKQFGLTQEGFEYWTNLAKTTQNTGSLFDPLPSQVTGNVQCTSVAKELVFGYFSASSVAEKRIFITPALGRYPSCEMGDTLSYQEALQTNNLLLNTYQPFGPPPLYLTASPSCADCRLQGGTNVKPAFWQ